MRSSSKLFAGVLFVSLALSACGSQVATQQTSETQDLESFDPANFNGGETWEYLVNPSYTRTGEHASETTSSNDQEWIDGVDTFAEDRENQNLAILQKNTPAANIPLHNAALAAVLTRSHATTIGYTKNEARQLYKQLVNLPQVTDHGHYDPEYTIGFCFGRAMIVHGLARNAFVKEGGVTISKKGVPVRKIWVTGPMGEWKHHVATMVAAKEAGVGFWVIDNYVGKVMSPADWMARLKSDYPTANVMFNVTRANRFSEANSLRYYQVLLDDPFFNDFFRDFLTNKVPTIVANGGIDLTPSSTESIAGGGANPMMFGGSAEEAAVNH